MKKFALVIFLIQVLFSYTLVVNSPEDAKKLADIGIECKYDDTNEVYNCVSSNDLAQLNRIKGYLAANYNIISYISEDNDKEPSPKKTEPVKEEKKPLKVSLKKNISSLPKSGYCIQIASSPSKSGMLKLFGSYSDYEYARVEKIGGYYVLRVGEGDYKSIKNLRNEIKKGFVRKCDYIPDRIIKSNTNVNDNQIIPSTKTSPLKKSKQVVLDENINSSMIENKILNKNKAPNVKDMYDALNSGDLITAQKMAEKMKNTKNSKDAYNVLGIVSIKKGNWKKACDYLKKSNDYNLMKTACYTYNIKTGYSILQTSPKKSLKYFYAAKKYKNDKNSEIAVGYAYLNMKNYKKAKKIFEKLYNRYPNDKNVIKGYVIALYNLKDYERLKELKEYLPKEYANELDQYDLYIALDRADKLMKAKKYNEAEGLLLKLYRSYPDNINVLLNLASLYFNTNELDKSENFYNNVLLLNPQNIYALEGLRGIEIKRGNYPKALKYSKELKRLGVETDDKKIEDLYYMQQIRDSLRSGKCSDTKEYLKMLNAKNSAAVYMLKGDYYTICQKDKREAFLNYQKGYRLGGDNFDIKLKFLYALLQYDMFAQIKIVLDEINPQKLTPEQKNKLRAFYADLYVKYASYKFKNKEYKTAIDVCDTGMQYDALNPALYEIKGWSCFRLKKYECAKESFKKALELKDDEKTKYALALTYINLKENEKAEKILDELSTTSDKELKIKVANGYTLIGQTDKAQQVLNSINIKNESEKKVIEIEKPEIKKSGKYFPDVFEPQSINKRSYDRRELISFKKIKKADKKKADTLLNEYEKAQKEIVLKKNNYLSSIEAGVNLRTKTGTSGESKLSNFLTYLKGRYFFNNKSSIYAKLGFLNLKSGSVANYNNIGSGGVITNDDWITSYSGFIPKIGYSYNGEKIFNVELGLTPLGSKSDVSKTFTGKVSFGIDKNNKKMLLTLSRESVKDSILSYVGNNDPYSNNSWGRVLDNQLKFEYENIFDEHDSMFYASAAYSYLNGENVNENQKLELNLFPLKYVGDGFQDYDYAGVFGMFQMYKNNENSFYYYNGGYFSPKYFLLIAPRYEGYSFFSNKKLGIKSFVMGGPLYYKDTTSTFTLGFEAGAYAKYILGKSFVLKGGLDLRKSTDYTDFYLNLGLQYYFGNKVFVSKKELNNNMKEMLRTW